MKTVKIYERKILERGLKGFFKEEIQITVFYDDKKYSNHYTDINNPRLRKPFNLVLNTRNKNTLNQFITTLSNKSDHKWLKNILNKILEN